MVGPPDRSGNILSSPVRVPPLPAGGRQAKLRSPMGRPVVLALAALSLFLLAFTLVPAKPGLPTNLKADEPAYYLMAWSLAADRDLRCDLEDVGRLFREFPLSSTRNLVLMSDDGWQTAYYGKPYLYPLFSAPFVALFGGNGMLFANMLLTLVMLWLGVQWLVERGEEGWAAALFATGFVFLSAGFVYIFWLQPEVFNMAAITVGMYLGLSRRPAAWQQRHGLWLSGLAIALAAYNKPVLAAVGLPMLWRGWSDARLGGTVRWSAGCLAGLGLAALGSLALTGHPTSYLGVTRMGVEIEQPSVLPFAPESPAAAASPTPTGAPLAAGATGSAVVATPTAVAEEAVPEAPAPTVSEGRPGNSWWWIFRFPDAQWAEVREDVAAFLFGRHTGLFWYHPFAVLAVLLFLLHDRRSIEGWLLLGGLAVVALFFLLWIPWNYQGGGGFVGNRYYVNVIPAFLFLVPAVRPRFVLPAGYAAAGLLVAPLLFTPFGWPVAWSTLQAHVRNFPYPHFPLELSLRNVPGYESALVGGIRFQGRRDQFLPQGDGFWVAAADRAEIWLASWEPLSSAAFRVRNLASHNHIRFALAGQVEQLDYAEVAPTGEERELRFTLGEPTRTTVRRGVPTYYYRLDVLAERGEVRVFTLHAPPARSTFFAHNPQWDENFFVGASFTYLGPVEALDRDVYGVAWEACEAPPVARVGSTFTVRSRVRNTSSSPWSAQGAAALIKLAYHWRQPDGTMAILDGVRTALPTDVAAGELLDADQTVRAPDTPGRYLLEVDLLYEFVSWFADRTGGKTCRVEVDITP